MPAISSIASSRDTIAFSRASILAPSAMVIDRTAGIATGTEATSRISTNSASLRTSTSRASCTATRITARTAAMAIRKSPMRMTAAWKCDVAPALCTRVAVRPKKVLPPVAVTTASISPCLAIEPL